MSGNPNPRRPSARLRLGAVAALAAGLGGLALVGLSRSQAEAGPFTPQVAATFTAADRLAVAVALANPGDNELAGTLRVDLLGADGKELARAQKAINQKEHLDSYRLELPADKTKTADLTLRCRLGGREFSTPLAKVLLVKGHETSLSTGEEFFAGSNAPFRVDVHGVHSVKEDVPLAGADVTVRLIGKDGKGQALFEGRTPADGRIDAEFRVPSVPAGRYTLEVVTKSPLGEEKLQRAVEIKADAKVLLLSDKPVYQPGQEMHLRALVLRPLDLRPVENAALLFEVEDGKGNKVFKRAVKTSAFGVASADFQLADEVNQGDYRLRAVLNDVRAEKTVNVKRYVLPRFKINVTADKRFYLPKETLKVELQSDYFFGKAVSGAKVQVAASTFDVAFREFTKWQGQTDEQGHAKFEVKLPDYFVGQPLQHGNALLKLDVKVTDTADHSEQIAKSYTVSAQPIQVNLIPEGGKLVPGMANRFFAAAVYPDGSPAACDVKLWIGKEARGKPLAAAKTNDTGLAEFTVTPKAEQLRAGGFEQRTVEMLGGKRVSQAPQILFDVVAEAADREGNKATQAVALSAQPLGENVLLRLNKAVYRSADTLEADVRTSAGLPTAYLDVTRGGQLFLSRWLDVKGGRARYKLDLPPGLFGSVEVHAYQILASGEIIRDSRVVYVQPRSDLKVQVKASKDVYKPGENGRLRFTVTDAAGKPTQAALGVIVVDEAVYALQDIQPGLEKVYFTLQEELLKPQAQVKYQPVPIDHLIRRRVVPPRQQQVAEVLLTAIKVQPPARWRVAPDVERKGRYAEEVRQVAWALYRYAWGHTDYMNFDDKAGRWQFLPDVTGLLLKAGFVNPRMLQDPLGGKLSVEELAHTEKGFTAEALTRSITRLRMKRLAEALVKLADARKAEWFKDGRWALPPMALPDAARQAGLTDSNWLEDAWGQAFKLVTTGRKHDNATGHRLFDRHDIVSAGPDRDFETADDLRWAALAGTHVAGWWSSPEADRVLRQGRYGFNAYADSVARLDRNHWALEEQRLRELAENRHLIAREVKGPGGRFEERKTTTVAKKGPGGRTAEKSMKRAKGGRPMPTKEAGDPAAQGDSAAPITRVREYFPETLLWQPNLVTDEKGVADLAVGLADSITTWRLSASASSRQGALGGAQAPLKVFQDFFVEPDLPVSLTQNDEVAFPVAVYNYLQKPQTVKLELQQADWFELADGQGPVRELKVKPGDVTAVRFRIRARRIGFQPLLVKAFGSAMSDAVKRLVEVVPDGQKVEKVYSDRLSGKVTHVIAIPENAVADASKILVRVYPGVMAQVLEGVDGLLRLPGG
jgi:hypothetical protein